MSAYNRLIVLTFFHALSFTVISGENFESDLYKFNFDNILNHQELEKFVIVRMNVSEANDKLEVNIREIKISEGHLKEIAEVELANTNGNILCEILNDDQTVLKKIVVNNPTRLRLEYPNTDNTIGSQEVNIAEREILIRFTYTPEMKFLVISRFSSDNKPEIIKTVPLIEK